MSQAHDHTPGVHQIRVIRANQSTPEDDAVAVEEPLEIRLGYHDGNQRQQTSISITMRTPGNDVELATGFLLTEGIIDNAESIERAFNCGPPVGPAGTQNVVRVELSNQTKCDIDRLKRNFYTTSSCGVCGKSSLEALHVQGARPIEDDQFQIESIKLRALPELLRRQQTNFTTTGGIHASAAFDSSGKLLQLFEDVGRHNALDKLIGANLQQDQLPMSTSGILVSGRASFELIQKAMMAGCPLLAAVGAPSSLAVDAAAQFNMTLVGFLKPSGFNIYCGEYRVEF